MDSETEDMFFWEWEGGGKKNDKLLSLKRSIR